MLTIYKKRNMLKKTNAIIGLLSALVVGIAAVGYLMFQQQQQFKKYIETLTKEISTLSTAFKYCPLSNSGKKKDVSDQQCYVPIQTEKTVTSIQNVCEQSLPRTMPSPVLENDNESDFEYEIDMALDNEQQELIEEDQESKKDLDDEKKDEKSDIEEGTCKHILATGKRKGQECGRPLANGQCKLYTNHSQPTVQNGI